MSNLMASSATKLQREKMTPTNPSTILVSVSEQIPDVAPLGLLAAYAGQPRIYAADPDNGTVIAGAGVALDVIATGDFRYQIAQEKLRSIFRSAVFDHHSRSLVRAFGGFAFQTDPDPDPMWRAFHSAYFIIPSYQLTQGNGETWLTVSRLAEPEDTDVAVQAARAELRQIAQQVYAEPTGTPTIEQLTYPLAQSDWRYGVNDATRRIRAGDLEKVVLARICEVRFSAMPEPTAMLARLGTFYPDTYRFLVEPEAGYAFFGATPELLVRVKGSCMETAALAGSTRRGADPSEDAALASELLASSKERHEHDLVVQGIRVALEPVTTVLRIPAEPGLLRLRNIQHLHTPMEAVLMPGMSIFDVVEALHPTPALGGTPRDTAMSTIRRLEGAARGWYAAPVGWIDAEGNGMFAVAIRSAVMAENNVRLYAGAGIVADSQPDREWDETALKFRPLLSALGAIAS